MKETARTRTKPSSRTASKQPVAVAKPNEDKDDSGGGVNAAQKNAKKRKINIFPTGNDDIQFSFMTMSNVCFFAFLQAFFAFCLCILAQ